MEIIKVRPGPEPISGHPLTDKPSNNGTILDSLGQLVKKRTGRMLAAGLLSSSSLLTACLPQ